MGIERRKKNACLILQSDSSQQISQSQCHSITNSPALFQAFCCHAAACIFFSTTECEMYFELQQGVRVSPSFSLFFSLSLSAPCQVIGTIFPLFSCPLFLLFICHHPENLLLLPHTTPSSPAPPPPPCAGLELEMREAMGGFDWLRCWDVILCKLKCEVYASGWVCVSKREGAGAMCDARFIGSQAHLFVFYTSFRLRRAGSTFWLRVTQFHSTMRLSLSLII